MLAAIQFPSSILLDVLVEPYPPIRVSYTSSYTTSPPALPIRILHLRRISIKLAVLGVLDGQLDDLPKPREFLAFSRIDHVSLPHKSGSKSIFTGTGVPILLLHAS